MRYRLAVLAALALSGAACVRQHSDDNAFDWTQQLPAGAVVHLRDGDGAIDVRATGSQSAHVHATTRWRRSRGRDIHFTVATAGPNEYYICAMWPGSGRCGSSGYHGASRGFNILTLFSLFHHGNDATANFIVELPPNVVVDAQTSNGAVTIDGASAGVRARAMNGTVNATHVSGPVGIHTTNGEIHLSADSLGPADSVDVSTVNGMIVAQLPAQTDGAWDLRVTNGVVKSDFALAAESSRRGNRHLTGQIGSSSRQVRMHAVNGMITVNHPAQPSLPATAAAVAAPPIPPPAAKKP